MKTIKQVSAEIDAMIDKYGWAVQAVFATDADTDPPFAYTTGLADKGLPELIVFGLPPQVAHMILNNLARRMWDSNGLDPAPGVPLVHVIEQGTVMLVEADRDKADKFMFAARNRHPDYRALQLIWPDKNRKMPWDAGYDHAQFDRFQPMLTQTAH